MEEDPEDDNIGEYLMGQSTPKPTPGIAQVVKPYSIIQDLKNTQCNITFAQLLMISPTVRAELSKGLWRPKETTVEANNVMTHPMPCLTALCCLIKVNGIPITLIIDSGASESVVSKFFLDQHGIIIK